MTSETETEIRSILVLLARLEERGAIVAQRLEDLTAKLDAAVEHLSAVAERIERTEGKVKVLDRKLSRAAKVWGSIAAGLAAIGAALAKLKGGST